MRPLAHLPLQAHDLWVLQLPAGQSVYNRPYGIFFIAGSWVVTMIYAKWLLEVGPQWGRGWLRVAQEHVLRFPVVSWVG